MPKIDLEKNGRLLQLLVSMGNMLLLAVGLIWAVATFWGDTKQDSKQVAVLSGKVESVRDEQIKSTSRLVVLETQNIFILQSLSRLENGMNNRSPRL